MAASLSQRVHQAVTSGGGSRAHAPLLRAPPHRQLATGSRSSSRRQKLHALREPLAVGITQPQTTVIPVIEADGSEGVPLHVEAGKVVQFDAVPHLESLHELSAGRLFVVDVYTQWCGPCKMIAPEIEKMAEEFGDKVILSKIDCTTDNGNKKWAMAEKVRALPTFIFFKNGKRISEMTGAKVSSLRKLIEAHM